MNTLLAAFADNLKNTLIALEITWKGMLGIFVVIGIIFIVVLLLNALTVKEKRDRIFNKIKAFFKRMFMKNE